MNNRDNLINFIKEQHNIDIGKAATEKQFAPRSGLNIDSRKLDINEFNTIKTSFIKNGIPMESNGVHDYFIRFKKERK